jgi:hypothetical protein
MSHSPFSQFVKKHVSKMVQALSKLQRVDQGRAPAVVHFQLFKVAAGDRKGGYAPVARFDADAAKIAAAGQQKGAFEQVGLFDGTLHGRITSFQMLDFFREMR